MKPQSPRCSLVSFQTFIRDGQDHLLLQSVEGHRCLQTVTQISPTPGDGVGHDEAELEPSRCVFVATQWFLPLKVRPATGPPFICCWPELYVNCDFQLNTRRPNHHIAELPPQTSCAETLWNIIEPFTEFCLDRQDAEEAFALWVPYTLIIVQVTVASEPNKRCLRKQGIRHQLWFMGSWKKCSTQKNNT